MEDKLIDFDTAKLAKKKGFNLETVKSYDNKGTLSSIKTDNSLDIISAPTQSLLKKWLREKFNIIISINFNLIEKDDMGYVYEICDVKNFHTKVSNFKYYTYEGALKDALIRSLKIIKNNHY